MGVKIEIEGDFLYKFKKASFTEKVLWYCAGADDQLLEYCTKSDRVKYFTLGGIVLATGVLASIAGGYAFYTIFEPRGSALDKSSIHRGTMLMSLLFGLLWGAMIFNLDRFIVSSSGKGDGTEKITWDEIKTALPRILMGTIIAITISKPLEIRMFKSEIDAALHEEQLIKEKEYEERTRAVFDGRLQTNQKDLEELKQKQSEWESSISKLEEEFTSQLQGRAGAGPGDGPRSQALRRQKVEVELKFQNWKSENKAAFDRLSEEKLSLEDELKTELSKNKLVSNGLDGLLERIKLAHEIAGWIISIFITLLFMAIELTPIFFKLTLTRTPYDLLKENIEQLILAEKGVLQRQEYHQLSGKLLDFIEFRPAEQVKVNKLGFAKIEDELLEYAHAKYKEVQTKLIDEDPGIYIHRASGNKSEGGIIDQLDQTI